LEAHLSPEQIPFLDAFIAGEKPREIAQRLGITAKAASARMRRFKAKLAELYTDSRPD
jgi:DNA-directed RNA polymerase specialized sigma24 family protein